LSTVAGTHDVIHVACQADVRLLPDCAVMLHSLFTANPGERFDIHFMHDAQQGASELEGLAQLAAQFGAAWSPCLIAERLLAQLPYSGPYGGYAACYRLLLPQLLPTVSRVLYLDADILVADAIRPLWETDLGGRSLGAVTNPLFQSMVPRVRDSLGLADARDYFNSGVLLLDLQRLRDSGLAEALLTYARKPPVPIPWPDQDSLNAVLWQHRLPLHPRWNATSGLFELPRRYMPWSEAEVDEAVRHPAIVHFVGAYKPWHYRNRHPYRAHYFAHLSQTAWRGRGVEGFSLGHALLRPLPALWQLKIEPPLHGIPAQLRKLMPPADSTSGGLLRDGLRLLTPRRPRQPMRLLLEALAYGQEQVYFAQIGSNDATHNDPLKEFIRTRQWSGIMVEPVPYVFARLRQRYGDNPRLTLENLAIGAVDGETDFYYVAQTDEPMPEWYDQLGSFSREQVLKHAEYIPGLEQRIVQAKVPTLGFESMCRKHGIGAIDLIHIDAEGYDFEVLKLIDLKAHTPQLILFEHKHLTPEQKSYCYQYLGEHGYALLEDGWDTVCVSRRAISRPWSRLGRAWRIASAQSRRSV
jgi:FkbM family methyltransferase